MAKLRKHSTTKERPPHTLLYNEKDDEDSCGNCPYWAPDEWQKEVCRDFSTRCAAVAWALCVRIHPYDGYGLLRVMEIAGSTERWLRGRGRVSRAVLSKESKDHHRRVLRSLRLLERNQYVTFFQYGPRLKRRLALRPPLRYKYWKQGYPDSFYRDSLLYVLHLPLFSYEIRNWHREQGIVRKKLYHTKSQIERRKAEQKAAREFEVIAFPGSVKESPQSG